MLKEKLPIFLINTLLLHIPLLALTHSQTELRRNKYTRCKLAGGTESQFVDERKFICELYNTTWRRILTWGDASNIRCPSPSVIRL